MKDKLRPDFSELPIDTDIICWGQGNKAIGPRIIARFNIDPACECQKKEVDEAEMKKYLAWKAIYDDYILTGTRFTGNKGITAKITRINYDSLSVSFLQENAKEVISKGYKPAKGKMYIGAFIAMVINESIRIISNP